MDKIIIKNLEVFANHGVFPEETALGQKFIVSAELLTDTRKAGKTDELEASIHYGLVSAEITKYMKEHTCKLIEAAAEGRGGASAPDLSSHAGNLSGNQKALGTGGTSAGDCFRGD